MTLDHYSDTKNVFLTLKNDMKHYSHLYICHLKIICISKHKNGGHLGNDVIETKGPDRFFLFCPKCLVEVPRIPKIPSIDLGKHSSMINAMDLSYLEISLK